MVQLPKLVAIDVLFPIRLAFPANLVMNNLVKLNPEFSDISVHVCALISDEKSASEIAANKITSLENEKIFN